MSLRWKVALTLAATAIVISLTIGLATYRVTNGRLLIEVDRSLVAFDPSYLRRQVPAGSPDPFRGFDLQQIDAGGTVFASSLPRPLAVSSNALAVVDHPGREVFETVRGPDGPSRVRTIGVRGGAIQVLRSLGETQRVLASLRTRMLILGLMVSVAASILGWLVADRITASLRRLTLAARQVESTGRLDGLPSLDEGVPSSDEVGQLQSAFVGMLDTLSRSQEAQSRLVQDAGHELRTPLTSLRTNVDTLGRYGDLSSAQRDEIIADLRAETAELTTLVNELVAAGTGDLTREPPTSFDLATLVTDLAQRYERRYDRAIDVEATPSPIFGRRSAVQRAVSCLLDNAGKFDTSGGPITVRVDGPTVTVADRGDGIDPAESTAIFERFHRAPSARTMPGSGLGLSIVREVAETHGGTATWNSRDGGGSEFTLSLGDGCDIDSEPGHESQLSVSGQRSVEESRRD